MRTSWITSIGSLMLLVACDGGVAVVDAGAHDAALDGGVRPDAADVGVANDARIEDGAVDAGEIDAEVADAGDLDASAEDAAIEMDAGSDPGTDAGSDAGSDAGTDAATIDPCTPLPSGLTTFTRTDTASVGTPDSYFLDVTPGDPFCASITGGGSGSWTVNVSNGTSAGLYCSGDSTCSIIVPPGQTTLIVTAVTTDIGGYTLTVHYRPR